MEIFTEKFKSELIKKIKTLIRKTKRVDFNHESLGIEFTTSPLKPFKYWAEDTDWRYGIIININYYLEDTTQIDKKHKPYLLISLSENLFYHPNSEVYNFTTKINDTNTETEICGSLTLK